MNATNIPASGPKIELPNTAYILPDNIAMWPPVWWTWLVVGALVILLISLMTIKFISYKRNLYRRDAIKLIDTLEELDDVAFLTQCHQIIRRCLLTLGRNDLASLPSQDLFDQLDLGLSPKYQFKQLGSVLPAKFIIKRRTEGRNTSTYQTLVSEAQEVCLNLYGLGF